MNKISLALTFLAAGAGAFQAARQHANQLNQKAQAATESWQIHTQQIAAAQSEQALLTERVRGLNHALTQSQSTPVSALWLELQTNRTEDLPPDLRRRLLAELGFDWRTSPDYVIVSKGTVRDLGIEAVRDGRLTDLAATVLALTPDERGQIAAAFEGFTAPVRDWMLAHIERHEPTEELLADFNLPGRHPGEQPMSQQISNVFAFQVSREVGREQAEKDLATATVKTLAHYTLPEVPKESQTTTKAFTTALTDAVGRERAELILPWAESWMESLGVLNRDPKPVTMWVVQCQAGNTRRLLSVVSDQGFSNLNSRTGGFPKLLQLLFPNGWTDVAQREGFELPPPPEKK